MLLNDQPTLRILAAVIASHNMGMPLSPKIVRDMRRNPPHSLDKAVFVAVRLYPEAEDKVKQLNAEAKEWEKRLSSGTLEQVLATWKWLDRSWEKSDPDK